jgi:cytochrome b involved in lipid metabolism
MMLHARRICNTVRKSSPILLQSKRTASTNYQRQEKWEASYLLVGAAALAAITTGSLLYSPGTSCQESNITLTSLPSLQPQPDEVPSASLPIYTSSQVAIHDGKKTDRVWMSYGGYVYDVTDFIENHPGGQQKILLAAGGAIEPYWHCEYLIVFVCIYLVGCLL